MRTLELSRSISELMENGFHYLQCYNPGSLRSRLREMVFVIVDMHSCVQWWRDNDSGNISGELSGEFYCIRERDQESKMSEVPISTRPLS